MKKYLFILIAFATLIFTGCEKRTDGPEVGPSEASIEFTAEVAAGSSATPNGVASRVSASKTEFVVGNQIGVFVVPNSSGDVAGTIFSSGNYVDNEVFIASAEGTGLKFTATGTNTVTFPSSKTNVAIYAFAMYNTRYNTLGTNPEAVIWTVPTDQILAATIIENDVMTAQALNVAPGATPELTFMHRLAIAQVEVTPPGDTYKGKPITSITAKLRNVDPKATIDMTNNAVVVPNSSRTSLVDIDMYKSSEVGLTQVFEAIVPPQIYAVVGTIAATITVTTEDGSFSFDLPASSGENELKFEPGKRTKIPITFNDEYELSFGDVSITAWGNIDLTSAVARRPAVMNFTIANKGTTAATIVRASLTIDDVLYSSKASFDDATNRLSCVYMYHVDKFGDKLTKVILYNETGQIQTFDFAPSINIPGDPTAVGYDKVITTLRLN